MNKDRVQDLCWYAWRKGFSVALDEKVFVILVAFSVLFGRSLSFFMESAEIDIASFLNENMDLLPILENDAEKAVQVLMSRYHLGGEVGLVLPLFLLGVFLLVGVLGLMRDLLVRQGYQVQHVLLHGRHYFWPIILFKLPVYLLLGIISFMFLLPGFGQGGDSSGLWMWWIGGGIFLLGLFGLARVFLSLGPKIIVTEESISVVAVYHRVLKIVTSNPAVVIVFYASMLLVMGLVLYLSFVLMSVSAPFFWRALLTIFLLSYSTVIIKAAAFVFYLHLLDLKRY